MSLSSDLSGVHEKMAEDARLFILKELAAQTDGQLNVLTMQRRLDGLYGINRSREWVETQMRKLAELGAIDLASGAMVIGRINRTGRDHLAQRSTIAGVTLVADAE